jgi:hypothetical protein
MFKVFVMKKTFTILFLPMFLLISCYTTKVTGINVYNFDNDNYEYEILIKTHTVGRGSLHNMTFEKWESNGGDWIYTKSINGKISADSIIFTHWQRELEYPFNTPNIKGFINIDNKEKTIEINLFFYDQENKSKKDLPYEFNGIHKLNIVNSTIPRIQKRFESTVYYLE